MGWATPNCINKNMAYSNKALPDFSRGCAMFYTFDTSMKDLAVTKRQGKSQY